MILHYIKVAVRSLMKFKMQNIIAILGLAMSLFCFSICLYCSRYIYSTDSCFSNKDRITFIDTGIIFYGGIMLCVILLITLTLYVRIRDISRINPAEIIKNE